MNYIPCPYCEKLFSSDEAVLKHIRNKNGHGNKRCSCCKERLSKCKDISAVGQSFACKRK